MTDLNLNTECKEDEPQPSTSTSMPVITQQHQPAPKQLDKTADTKKAQHLKALSSTNSLKNLTKRITVNKKIKKDNIRDILTSKKVLKS